MNKFNSWITERRNSDDLRVSLIDKESVDIESRRRTSVADRIKTHCANIIRIVEVQSAPFLQRSKFTFIAIFFILCLLFLSLFGNSGDHSINVESSSVSIIHCFANTFF